MNETLNCPDAVMREITDAYTHFTGMHAVEEGGA